MKKILETIFLILFIFNKTIISQIIIFSASIIAERKISVGSIDINYAKNQIILNTVEVVYINKLYYEKTPKTFISRV